MTIFLGFGCFRKCSVIDKVQNRACRFYLGTHAKAPLPGLHGETGWMLPKYRHFLAMFRNWNRFNKMNMNRITRKVLVWDSKQNVKSWVNELRNICQKLVCDEPKLNELYNLKYIKELLDNLQLTEWKQSVLSKPKLRNYKIYKTTFEAEQYVCQYQSKRKRSLFAQLRLGILPLEIETGRYRRILEENRFCPFCKNITEDEMHFICVCPTYIGFREVMFKIINQNYPEFTNINNEHKFFYIMSCNNKCVLDFVEAAWRQRMSLLYK